MYLDAGADPILISATGVNPGTDRWPDVAHKGPIRSRPSSSAKRRHERRACASREAAAARIRPVTTQLRPRRRSVESTSLWNRLRCTNSCPGVPEYTVRTPIRHRRDSSSVSLSSSSKRPRSRPLAAPTALRPSRAPQVPAIESTQADEANGSKKLSIPFSICACHPCAGAMLIFSC